jgi:phenylacetic acid degradation operon negative regulatory protein
MKLTEAVGPIGRGAQSPARRTREEPPGERHGEEEGTVALPDEELSSNRTRASGRRYGAGAVSARSLLMTVLGEFVLPALGSAWTATLVDALGTVGVEEKAARQSLARTAAEGFLLGERVGRRTRWALSDSGRELLSDGAARIYGFMRSQRRWNGRWLVLAVTVPETQRQLRHQLRTRLAWAGLGSPAPGLWVTPNEAAATEVAKIVTDLGIGTSTMSWVGTSGAIGHPQQVVRAAWRLGDIEAAYARFIADFSHRTAVKGEAVFAAQVELVQAWRRFPFLDPALPLELLDHEWPGPAAAATFHRCHDLWHRPAQAYWQSLERRVD